MVAHSEALRPPRCSTEGKGSVEASLVFEDVGRGYGPVGCGHMEDAAIPNVCELEDVFVVTLGLDDLIWHGLGSRLSV